MIAHQQNKPKNTEVYPIHVPLRLLGCITYINLVTQQPTSDNSNTQQNAKNKDLNEQQQDFIENSHEEAEPPTNSSSSDQSKLNTFKTLKRFKDDEGTVNNKNKP